MTCASNTTQTEREIMYLKTSGKYSQHKSTAIEQIMDIGFFRSDEWWEVMVYVLAFSMVLFQSHLNASSPAAFLCKTFEFHVFWRLVCLYPRLGSALNDGQWHAVRLVAKDNFAMMTIDGDDTSAVRSTSPLTINTGGTYHLGGKGHPEVIAIDVTKARHLLLPPAFINIPSRYSPVSIWKVSVEEIINSVGLYFTPMDPSCVSVIHPSISY